MNKSVGFIGGGRVTKILLGGLSKAGKVPGKVVVSDPSEPVLGRLKEDFKSIETVLNDNTKAAGQDIVFLAVHPPAIGEVLKGVASALKPESILISLAPKFTLARLSEMLGGHPKIVRMIPNAPSIIGCGFNPVAFSGSFSSGEKSALLDLFSACGDCPEVPENTLEIYAILTAMGPTYLWYQLYELLSLSQSFGLSEKDAQKGLQSMLTGTVRTMFESGLSPEQVMDLIPVKPLAELEPAMTEGYRNKLKGVFEKIKP